MSRLSSWLFMGLIVVAATALAADHPLQPLTATEILNSKQIINRYFTSAGLPADRVLFAPITLAEPPKSAALAYLDNGGPLPSRRARVEAFHYPSNRVWVAVVDLGTKSVVSFEKKAAGTQSLVTATEFVNADTVVHANAQWKQAIRARGLDPDLVYVDVWAPGDVPGRGPLTYGDKTRLLRALAFYRGTKAPTATPQNPYDRPVEGVVATLDMNAETIIDGAAVQGRLVDLVDTGVRPVSNDSGNASRFRSDLNPLNVREPGGPNYTRSLNGGRLVRWQKWEFYVVLHPRVGLVLYDVRFDGRRVAYRLSLADAYVPYGINDPNWTWRTAFDIGEYWFATFASTLERDKDVPDNAQFFDAVFASDGGEPIDYPNTIGIYERFAGAAWARTDPTSAARDVRGARALVLHWNAWIGNYIYGFNWILGQDGTIEVETEFTGTTLNRGASPDKDDPADAAAPVVGNAPVVPGSIGRRAEVRAPNHQHFFNFRFDVDVDGIDNIAVTKDMVHVPPAAGGGETVFQSRETIVANEGSVAADPAKSREWEVHSGRVRNALGEFTAYGFELPFCPPPLSEPTYAPLLRAQFATQQFWVTAYKDGEFYAAGDFPNQGRAGEGLPSFVGDRDPLHANGTGADLVVWLTIGMTHSPRPEDYPVMPTEKVTFRMAPHGFFSSNPALDLR